MDPLQAHIIVDNPIGNCLDPFQEAFRSTCANLGISASAEAVRQVVKIGSEDLLSDLIVDILALPASPLLPSPDGRGRLVVKLATLFVDLEYNEQDLQAIVPLLTKVIEKAPDREIWDAVYNLVTKSALQLTPLGELTPPAEVATLTELAISTELTPLRELGTPRKPRSPGEFTTPSTPSSSEHRVDFDKELRSELGTTLYTDIPGFDEAFFGGVSHLKSIADTIFRKCQEGDDPIFNKETGGWKGWPNDAKEVKVLEWFQRVLKKFLELGPDSDALSGSRMRILRRPTEPVPGSVISFFAAYHDHTCSHVTFQTANRFLKGVAWQPCGPPTG